MSKKKAFGGNTMTLKDFHGGSIPTDLPLPSAPGVIVRQPDRAGYDRPQWGRSDHRSRPNSASASRGVDDRTPFLGNSVNIGRNFDEDERKPLDGVSAPRRTVSDESTRGMPSRVEMKSESGVSGRVGVWQGVNSYSGRVVDGGHEIVGQQNIGVSSGHGASWAYPNVWTARKEAAMGVSQQAQSSWSAQSAASKLAHASALEKVSSGLWQTKPSVHYQADIEVITHDDVGVQSMVHGDAVSNRVGFVDERKYYDEMLASCVERGLNIEDVARGGRKEILDHGRAGGTAHVEARERKSSIQFEGIQRARADVKYSSSELQAPVSSEPSERPKLKLLPRTKPLESTEHAVFDQKQGYQQASDHAAKSGNESLVARDSAKDGVVGTEIGSQAVDRPKLNLKPRAQPVDLLEGQPERERNALFGGARPREVVLKERGIDDIVSNNEIGQHADRVKHDAGKNGRVPGKAISPRPTDKMDNPPDQRPGRKFERKDLRGDAERVDMQRRNWRKEIYRNNKEGEKQKQRQPPQQQQERPPSPETWRKPVEEPKPASEASGVRTGKAASALELAQAFSRSVSDPKTADRYSGQRGVPGRSQIPFSRLTSPMPRKQINGY